MWQTQSRFPDRSEFQNVLVLDFNSIQYILSMLIKQKRKNKNLFIDLMKYFHWKKNHKPIFRLYLMELEALT